jgi:hypothetical protein
MNNEQHLCDYGCGQIAIKQFVNGRWCCSDNVSKCSGIKNDISNKVKGIKFTKEHIINMSKSKKGKKHIKGANISYKDTIKSLNIKYPLFSKIEEMRYDPNYPYERVLQFHCKNHNCKNSKEKDGWFTPTYIQRYERIRSINLGAGAGYLYCCNKCKEECPLYAKKIDVIIKEDKIRAGHIKEELYTSVEYDTWRNEVLKRSDYLCEYCEEKANHAHHSRPQKSEPGFVLDPDFGVACCEKCHYKYGHKTGTECSTGNLASTICR